MEPAPTTSSGSAQPPIIQVEAGQAPIQRTRSHLAYSIAHQMVPMDRSYGGPHGKFHGKYQHSAASLFQFFHKKNMKSQNSSIFP